MSSVTPTYLAGRYNKFSRTISQTPWIVDGKKKVVESVEEFLKTAVSELIPHNRSRFSASGREDVDVRMLGKGRPFVLELIDLEGLSTKDITEDMLIKITEKISLLANGNVTVRDLQVTTRSQVQLFLKEGEAEKKKQYRALCCINRPLSHEEIQKVNDSFQPLTINQKTPIRVLHRRPLHSRSRIVEELKIIPYDEEAAEEDGVQGDGTDNFSNQKFFLQVTSEAGTYIKELVHGDFGRTTPSLADVIDGGKCRTDIISLDVEEVFLDWPPSKDNVKIDEKTTGDRSVS